MSEQTNRRELFPGKINVAASFIVPDWKTRRAIQKWLITNTSGRYYLGGDREIYMLSFEDEADVLMFKLGPHYDRERIQKAEEAHPNAAMYKAHPEWKKDKLY